MKEGYFENKIPPQEVTPPMKKIPPQEITPPPDQEADFAQAENISEAPEKSIDLMAAAESGINRTEKEDSLEKKELMEKAQKERLAILGGVFTRVNGALEGAKEKMGSVREKLDDKIPKPGQELLSSLMDVSSLKMYAEAGRGKNFMGKELSPKERVISALIAGTNDLAKILFAVAAGSGNAEYAKMGSIVYGVSWVLLLAKNGPKMLQNLKELASYYHFGEASPVLVRADAALDQYGYQNLEERFEPSAY